MAIAKFYYKRMLAGLVKDENGNWNVNKVPSLWRDKVITLLKENGYIINEDGTVEKPEE